MKTMKEVEVKRKSEEILGTVKGGTVNNKLNEMLNNMVSASDTLGRTERTANLILLAKTNPTCSDHWFFLHIKERVSTRSKSARVGLFLQRIFVLYAYTSACYREERRLEKRKLHLHLLKNFLISKSKTEKKRKGKKTNKER